MPKRNETPRPPYTDADQVKELAEGLAVLYSELLAQLGGSGDDSPTPDGILLAASEAITCLGSIPPAPPIRLLPVAEPDDEPEEKPKRKRSARKRRDDDGDLPFDDEDEEDEQPKRRKRSSGRKARGGGGGGGRARKPRDASSYCACGCDCWQDYDEDYSGCDCDGDDCVNEFNGKETPCGCIRPKPLMGGDVVMVEGKNGHWRWLEEVA